MWEAAFINGPELGSRVDSQQAQRLSHVLKSNALPARPQFENLGGFEKKKECDAVYRRTNPLYIQVELYSLKPRIIALVWVSLSTDDDDVI